MPEYTVKIIKPGKRVVKINRGRDGLQGPAGPAGDMTGPVSSVIGNIPIFADILGNVLADSGADLDDFALAANVTALLADKQDTEVGKGLSTEDFTTAYKDILDGLTGGVYRGDYPTYADLNLGTGTGDPGDYALVATLGGDPAIFYFWDEVNTEWAPLSSGAALDGAAISSLLFAEPDTNNFTDFYQDRVDNSITAQEAQDLISTGGVGSVIDETTNARTLTLVDVGKYIYLSNVGGCTVTLPNDTTVLWSGNPTIELWVQTSVIPTFALGVGVVVNNGAAVITQYSTIRLKRVASNLWNMSVF